MKTRDSLMPSLAAACSATSSLEARNMLIKSTFLVASAAGSMGPAVSWILIDLKSMLLIRQ